MSGLDWSQTVSGLIQKYGHRLSRYLHVLIRNHHDEEEIFQEVFIAALQSYAEFTTDEDGRRWLFEIARRRALEYWRKSQRVKVIDHAIVLAKALAEADERIELHWAANLRSDALTACMAGLSLADQDLLAQRYSDPKPSIQELSALLNTTVQAVASKLKRIHQKLQECVGRKLFQQGMRHDR